MLITTADIDLTKTVFAVHGFATRGTLSLFRNGFQLEEHECQPP